MSKNIVTTRSKSKSLFIVFSGMFYLFPRTNWALVTLSGTEPQPSELFSNVREMTVELARGMNCFYFTLNNLDAAKRVPCEYLTVALASQHIAYDAPLNALLLKLSLKKPDCKAFDDMWSSTRELAACHGLRCACLNDLVLSK